MTEVSRELLKSRIGNWDQYTSAACDATFGESFLGNGEPSCLIPTDAQAPISSALTCMATPRSCWTEETRRAAYPLFSLNLNVGEDSQSNIRSTKLNTSKQSARVPYWPAASLDGPPHPAATVRTSIYLIGRRAHVISWLVCAIGFLVICAAFGIAFNR